MRSRQQKTRYQLMVNSRKEERHEFIKISTFSNDQKKRQISLNAKRFMRKGTSIKETIENQKTSEPSSDEDCSSMGLPHTPRGVRETHEKISIALPPF